MLGTRSKGIMRVHVHTKFCFLCVLTFLFHQCNHCHGEEHSHQHGGHPHTDHDEVHSDLQISEDSYVKGATFSSESKSPPGQTLEKEQHYYIQQLFSRYGQQDKLDFEGFQSLLFSLGLGEVKLVDAQHEELGHDHVAHLDLVDVQKGHHSHASTTDGHGHGHPHHKPASHHPHTEQNPTKCTQQTTAASPATGAHTGHDHDHAKVVDSEHKHSGRHVQDKQGHVHNHDHAHDKGHKHEQAHVHSNHKDGPSEPHDHSDHNDNGQADHDHSVHNHVPEVQTGTDIPPLSQEQKPSAQLEPSQAPQVPQSSPAPTETQTKKPRKPARVRGQRGRNKTSSPNTRQPEAPDHDHDHSHSYSHKDKREAPGGPGSPTLPVPVLSGHPKGLFHQHGECLNLTQLLTYYGLSPDSLISPSQFTYLCPALLYQIDSRVCIRHFHQMDVAQEALEPVSSVWVWLWGFVSITIISLLSLLGVVLVPILKQSCFKFLLTFLVALAVGTLSGDALLHLLPHSQGQHDHGEPKSTDERDYLNDFDGVWKGLTALAGIYFLFIVEHCIGMFQHYKDHKGTKKANEEGTIGRKLSDHKLNRRSDAEWLHLKPLSEDPEGTAVSCDNGHNDTQLSELQTPDSPTNKTPLAPKVSSEEHPPPNKENGGKAKKHGHSHGHSHGGNCHSDQEMKDAGIASIAWMVIMGDGMHNFSDGLAIGAAFSANLTGGISTSVAVFCHELPHELGDFAVLLKAGMSVKQAIFYNLLSALMAYVGMIIGTAVGQYTHNVTSWIFAVTAGMFLYVALVDMLPEMLHGDSEDHKRCQLGHFVLQNLGMLTGFGIMLLIAIFEDRIVFNFGF
ncbi:zinc transporter ZIP10 [Gymnodraco acuticeps]|uniref:Zinc transporter ZIP10 n=1 Tax=Gymnodraco acuticeps TaxID=8218 RepID=A0A6P8TKM4_GYMAC|nr:zinc transporter ZIP10 [Gymnodraco acuticeps]